MKICVLGDGGWGTTLAILLSHKGFDVSLWGAFQEYTRVLDKERVNVKFLPQIRIPNKIAITSDLEKAVRDAHCILIAVPTQYVRSVLKNLTKTTRHPQAAYVSASKGIETDTLKRVSEIVKETLPEAKNISVLSGPNISYEVARGLPTVSVVAAPREEDAVKIQEIMTTDKFRVYRNSDVVGVELGGALKNVIAIACGICDGMLMGANAKAALLTRGLAEIRRLGIAMGAHEETFSGISGLGDLVTTCTSNHGRNRWLGEQLGKGKTLEDILKSTEMVVEGITTAKSAYSLGTRYGVPMPITEEIYAILYKKKTPEKAVIDLMTRSLKAENI